MTQYEKTITNNGEEITTWYRFENVEKEVEQLTSLASDVMSELGSFIKTFEMFEEAVAMRSAFVTNTKSLYEDAFYLMMTSSDINNGTLVISKRRLKEIYDFLVNTHTYFSAKIKDVERTLDVYKRSIEKESEEEYPSMMVIENTLEPELERTIELYRSFTDRCAVIVKTFKDEK